MGWFRRAFGSGRARRGADAGVRRALLALLSRDPGQAEAELTAVARAHPDDPEVFRALALLLGQRGEFSRAIQIHQALLLRRDLPEGERVQVLGDLADDFRRAGFLKRAAAAYEEVLTHAPRDARALEGLAVLLRRLRDHGRALDVVRRLARIGRRSSRDEEAELRVAQADAAHAEGRSDDARRIVRRARRRHRGYAPALLLLGTLEAERGRNAAALSAWREAAEMDPRCGGFVYPRLEAAFAAAGRARDFATFLRELLEKRPDDATARIALARALAAWGEVDAAVAELRTLIERGGDGVAARAALVGVLLATGRQAELRAEVAALLELLAREAPAQRETSA